MVGSVSATWSSSSRRILCIYFVLWMILDSLRMRIERTLYVSIFAAWVDWFMWTLFSEASRDSCSIMPLLFNRRANDWIPCTQSAARLPRHSIILMLFDCGFLIPSSFDKSFNDVAFSCNNITPTFSTIWAWLQKPLMVRRSGAADRVVHTRAPRSSPDECAVGIQLVDPASVYMLVSKTKPCMSKYSIVE